MAMVTKSVGGFGMFDIGKDIIITMYVNINIIISTHN